MWGRKSSSLQPGGIIRWHNEQIGTAFQRFVFRLLLIYVCSPFVYSLLRLLVRVRVEGANHLVVIGDKAIYAVRHFYEWDPVVTYHAMLFPQALVRPHLLPLSLASHYWIQTRLRRHISWLFSVMGMIHGRGPLQSAFERAGQLLAGEHPVTIAIFPTGPIRQANAYELGPGVGYLALQNPEVPVIPVTVMGLQTLCLADMLRLCRPLVTVALGQPLWGREFGERTYDEQVESICREVEARWLAEERRFASRHARVLPAEKVESAALRVEE